MSEFKEAMKELGIPDSASPRTKLRAVCQWVFGDPGYASIIKEWVRESGYNLDEDE